jgi:ribose 1,5-bisphosphokinase
MAGGTNRSTAQGRLFFVVGASGAGKDTLLRYARGVLDEHCAIAFAHRYITRPVRHGGENHVALTEAEFMQRARRGLFAMHWESYGWHYGIGIEIERWLARGVSVVVNGSRAYITEARARYAELQVIWITADPATIARRLTERSRETEAGIAARLARNAELPSEPASDALRVTNDGAIEVAGARLVTLLSNGSRLL